jgi:hypothetical protein
MIKVLDLRVFALRGVFQEVGVYCFLYVLPLARFWCRYVSFYRQFASGSCKRENNISDKDSVLKILQSVQKLLRGHRDRRKDRLVILQACFNV